MPTKKKPKTKVTRGKVTRRQAKRSRGKEVLLPDTRTKAQKEKETAIKREVKKALEEAQKTQEKEGS